MKLAMAVISNSYLYEYARSVIERTSAIWCKISYTVHVT